MLKSLVEFGQAMRTEIIIWDVAFAASLNGSDNDIMFPLYVCDEVFVIPNLLRKFLFLN